MKPPTVDVPYLHLVESYSNMEVNEPPVPWILFNFCMVFGIYDFSRQYRYVFFKHPTWILGDFGEGSVVVVVLSSIWISWERSMCMVDLPTNLPNKNQPNGGKCVPYMWICLTHKLVVFFVVA